MVLKKFKFIIGTLRSFAKKYFPKNQNMSVIKRQKSFLQGFPIEFILIGESVESLWLRPCLLEG